jgi:hypothetical protein
MQAGPIPTASHTSSHFLPLILWLGVQLLALALAAMQVPLSDQFPRPAERMALDEMLVAQVLAATLLFPMLLPSAGATVLLIAATWPFLQLAGVLSSAPAKSIVVGGCYVGSWLLVLRLFRSALRTQKAELTGVAVATAIALGGAMMWYLRAEFALDTPAAPFVAGSTLGPIVGVLSAVHGNAGWASVWGPMAVAATIGSSVAAVTWRRRQSSRVTNHTTLS